MTVQFGFDGVSATGAGRRRGLLAPEAPREEQGRSAEEDGPSPRGRLYRQSVKRALDIALVILSLPVALPLIALCALAVAAQGGQPFFRQPRVGRGGKVFLMWKLRTMIPDADAALARHLASSPELNAEWTTHQKLKRDPRITAVGQFLRKSSLDELPQLWNVLKGDMSLVGPRPMLPEQQALYPGEAYYRLRPGITGLWQVSERNETFFAYRADCDSKYDRSVSLLLDLKLLILTVWVVMRGTGY